MASKQHTHKVDKRRNECGNVCLVCKKYRFLKPRAASHEPHPSTITNTCLIAFLQVSSQFLVLEGLKSHTLCPSPAFLKTRYSTTEYIGKISSTYNFTTSSIWQKWALSRQMLHYKPPAHHQSSLNVKLIFCWKQKQKNKKLKLSKYISMFFPERWWKLWRPTKKKSISQPNTKSI